MTAKYQQDSLMTLIESCLLHLYIHNLKSENLLVKNYVGGDNKQ